MNIVNKVNLQWCTPEGDLLLAEMARVSNPQNQGNEATAPKLIGYLLQHKHWSPFDMVNLCLEINTTRDIGRQILRHSSMKFQEFSQRYAEPGTKLPEPPLREARLQDHKNRQNSFEIDCPELQTWFESAQLEVKILTTRLYNEATEKGIAKEQARVFLPEGLTPTRMYVNGTLRSWIHFLEVRDHPHAQKEVREIAAQVKGYFQELFPMTYEAAEQYWERVKHV